MTDSDANSKIAAETKRLQSQYTEIATLAGGLAHEIRNPLSTISLNLNLLSEELEDSDAPRDKRMKNRLTTIQKACGSLEDVLNAFLQFARAGDLALEAIDVSELVAEFIEFYQPEADKHQIEISPHLGTGLPKVSIDPALMQRVLLNLVQNAQQAMPEGGILEIQTYEQNNQINLEIIDNGLGMDELSRSKMFNTFYSSKPGGSGLGLPTVRKIVEAHNGNIRCESEKGQGTRFTISLPVK